MPEEFNFLEVSVVSITDELIAKVAAKAGVPIERVRAYLGDDADQERTLFKAFMFYGVSPFNKKP